MRTAPGEEGFEKTEKKVLTKLPSCGKINELSQRVGGERTLKIEQELTRSKEPLKEL